MTKFRATSTLCLFYCHDHDRDGHLKSQQNGMAICNQYAIVNFYLAAFSAIPFSKPLSNFPYGEWIALFASTSVHRLHTLRLQCLRLIK